MRELRYLAIDATGEPQVVLLNANGKTFVARQSEPKKTSELLLTMIDGLLNRAAVTLNDLDFLAVVTGPGSFTGIRLGVVTIKSLAYALSKPVVALTSLQKLAYNNDSGERAAVVVHGYADNCFVAEYDGETETRAAELYSYENARTLLENLAAPRILADEKAQSQFSRAVSFDDGESLKTAVEKAYARGAIGPQSAVEPFYLLRSQAERNLES